MLPISSITFKKDFTPFSASTKFEFRPGINLLVGDQGAGKSTLIYLLINATKVVPKHKVANDKVEVVDEDGEKGTMVVRKGHYQKQAVEYTENPEFADVLYIDRDTNFSGPQLYHDTERGNPRIIMEGGGARWDMIAIQKVTAYLMEHAPDDETAHFVEDNIKNYISENKMDDIDEAIISRFKSHGQVLLPMIEQFAEVLNGLAYIDEPETALSLRSQVKMTLALKTAASHGGSQLFVATHCKTLIESVPEVLSLQHGRWMSSADFLASQE